MQLNNNEQSNSQRHKSRMEVARGCGERRTGEVEKLRSRGERFKSQRAIGLEPGAANTIWKKMITERKTW